MKVKKAKQKRDRYEMHKYWGKKPAKDLAALIARYSDVNEVVMDPFSGYGVFCCEAYLMNRNVISNDLNPVSIFIQRQLLESEISIDKFRFEWKAIESELFPFIDDWYGFEVDGMRYQAVSVLRDKKDKILKCKYTPRDLGKQKKYVYSDQEASAHREKEENFEIEDWFPTSELLENSRISVGPGFTIADIFTVRTLACHARLLYLINEISSGKEKELFKLTFTSNLANCSKLVPPIKSRDEMAPGAWMTGYYVGPTYLENNVLHYFRNRVHKTLRGKSEYLEMARRENDLFSSNGPVRRGEIRSFGEFSEDTVAYLLLNGDSKCLLLPDDSVDYVFTDPPYGDSVPYFEQSAIWNNWLGFTADFENEIVISDSKKREKDAARYRKDIESAFREIYRILKPGRHFSLTYHSLSGREWKAITNGCLLAGFELESYSWIKQVTFTPRQINRAKTVKGDVLMTLKKPMVPSAEYNSQTESEAREFILGFFHQFIDRGKDTNAIFLKLIHAIFENKIILPDIDAYQVLKDHFVFDGNCWRQK
ncbi:MAG: hypothetical protein AAF998_05620 [Bacteroidota bacterium]